jgi:DNA-binding IscR family transcriptional regulator
LALKKAIVLFEGSQAAHVRPTDTSGVKMKMSIEHCWNDTDRKKAEVLRKQTVQVLLCPP